jgi:hypothetical protein
VLNREIEHVLKPELEAIATANVGREERTDAGRRKWCPGIALSV